MKEYFSTTDMCRIFGVGRETLRHYENVGLLIPSVNPENGYRMYGYWDVGTMVDILKYKNAGFSLQDTKKAIFEMDFSDITGALEQQQQYYHDRIANYMQLSRKTSYQISFLHNVHGQFNVLNEFYTEPMVYIPYTLIPMDEHKECLYRKIFKNSLFFSTAWVFRPDTANASSNSLGFVTEREFADHLQISDGEFLDKTHAVGALMDITGRDEVERDTFSEFENKVKKCYPNASEETYATLISRFYDKDRMYHQYIFVYKPLTD